MENKQIIYKDPYTKEEFIKVLKQTFKNIFEDYKDTTENINMVEKKDIDKIIKEYDN